MTTQATDLIATFQRRPLDRARRLAAIRSLDEMRVYLAETGSAYADHADDGMVRAAFLGAVQFQLDDLANSYEQQITRHACAVTDPQVLHDDTGGAITVHADPSGPALLVTFWDSPFSEGSDVTCMRLSGERLAAFTEAVGRHAAYLAALTEGNGDVPAR